MEPKPCDRKDCKNPVNRSDRTINRLGIVKGQYNKFCSSTCSLLTVVDARANKCMNRPWQEAPITHTAEGYVIRILGRRHPRGRVEGRTLEHILVMEDYLDRKILRGETIHHKNGIKFDNRIENLELRTGNHGPNSNIEDLINWATQILELYRPEKLK